MADTSKQFLGEFDVKLKLIKPASSEVALRQVNISHVRDLVAGFVREYENGHTITIPTACGFVPDVVDEEAIRSGKQEIELVDGNHMHMANLELNDKYPEESIFNIRYNVVLEFSMIIKIFKTTM